MGEQYRIGYHLTQWAKRFGQEDVYQLARTLKTEDRLNDVAKEGLSFSHALAEDNIKIPFWVVRRCLRGDRIGRDDDEVVEYCLGVFWTCCQRYDPLREKALSTMVRFCCMRGVERHLSRQQCRPLPQWPLTALREIPRRHDRVECDRMEDLRRVMRRMPVVMRMLLECRYKRGLTGEETADYLGVQYNEIRSRTARALRLARKLAIS